MKKKIILFSTLLIITSLLLNGCTIKEKTTLKTEYLKGESAIIDDYKIIYKGYSNQNNELYVDFLLTNKSNQLKELDLNKSFVLYTNDYLEITNNNLYQEKIKIEPNETQQVRVTISSDDLFDNEQLVNLTSYKILFYSGVVTNNIAFIIEK